MCLMGVVGVTLAVDVLLGGAQLSCSAPPADLMTSCPCVGGGGITFVTSRRGPGCPGTDPGGVGGGSGGVQSRSFG